jgi:hypothetical protein
MLIRLSQHICNKYCNYFHIIRTIITIVLVWLKMIKLIYFNIQYIDRGGTKIGYGIWNLFCIWDRHTISSFRIPSLFKRQ